MIVFDLDGTLADCEHRRHFVDIEKAWEKDLLEENLDFSIGGIQAGLWSYKSTGERWHADWDAFHAACDKDKPIEPTLTVIRSMLGRDYYANDEDIHIWSGRSESVRGKTEKWLEDHGITYNSLKMRPIGDNSPAHVLKERWLEEGIIETKWGNRNKIDFVFESDAECVKMWRSYGIFVFSVNQGKI